jgi:hypothetical protein
MKAEGHLDRCYLKGRARDAANAILSAVGYNFRRINGWLSMLLVFIRPHYRSSSHSDRYSIRLLNGRRFTNPV